jgi:hypothetical protein
MAAPPHRRSGIGHLQNDDPISSLELANAERKLVELMRRVGFGRLEHAEVRDGQLRFGRPFRVVRDVKLGASDKTLEPSHDPFSLKKEVREFVSLVRGLDSAVIRKVEIRHGLPVHIQIEEGGEDFGGGC